MSDNNKRISTSLSRDLYTLEDESNPRGSTVHTIWPFTILDNVFDNQSPTNKNLRQILEDLKIEIITGGRGNIVFPVTTVNGKEGDVVIDKVDIGLGLVDNTRDIDKPLSVPQRTAIEEILANYTFQVNLDDLYDHLTNMGNPHDVTIDQINKDDLLTNFVRKYIGMHNISRDSTTHTDIRNSLSRLWTLVNCLNDTVEGKVDRILETLNTHTEDPLAHQDLFSKKEDSSNKMTSFDVNENSDHSKYPSTRAVVEFLSRQLGIFRKSLPDVQNWIDDIIVIENRDALPNPSARYVRKAYFIRHGNSSHSEVAVCKVNPNGYTFTWDISTMGAYTKFNKDHFVDTVNGLSINMTTIIEAVLDEGGALDTSLAEVLKDYYRKDDIDGKNFVQSVHIIPGTLDGTVRVYVNDDVATVSEDVKVAGLHRLAYLEYVTENELQDQSVHGRHILSKSIERRHIVDGLTWDVNSLECRYGYLIGNTKNASSTDAHEIPLIQLADALRPLIGGWPDPDTPGGNPWNEILDQRVVSPHLLDPGQLYPMSDKSYVIRFTGEISVIPNMDKTTILSTELNLSAYRLVEAGGAWQYQSDPDEWTILGGSNITGHTFATVVMTENGVQLESISIGNRTNAQYDIWIRVTKNDEMSQIGK